MVFINEWLPNPVGNDANGEFAELYNDGPGPISMNGYTLATDKKKASLAGYTIPAKGFLVLKKAQTKLTFKNMDGVLGLYGPGGHLIDSGSFVGTALEGKSFSRVNYDSAPVEHFAFTDPTPGRINKTIDSVIHEIKYPTGVPLDAPLATIQFLGIMAGTAFLLTGLILYCIISHEDLSNLFFERNHEAG